MQAAWLLNQNPRPRDQYPKKLNSQKAVNCLQLSSKQRIVSLFLAMLQPYAKWMYYHSLL